MEKEKTANTPAYDLHFADQTGYIRGPVTLADSSVFFQPILNCIETYIGQNPSAPIKLELFLTRYSTYFEAELRKLFDIFKNNRARDKSSRQIIFKYFDTDEKMKDAALRYADAYQGVVVPMEVSSDEES